MMIGTSIVIKIVTLLDRAARLDCVITEQEKVMMQNRFRKEFALQAKDENSRDIDLLCYEQSKFALPDESLAENTDRVFDSLINFIEEKRDEMDEWSIEICTNFMREIASAYYDSDKKYKSMITNLRTKLDIKEVGLVQA